MIKRFFDWIDGVAGEVFLLFILFGVGAGVGWAASAFGIDLGGAILERHRIVIWPYDTEAHRLTFIVVGSVVGGATTLLLVFRASRAGGRK